MSCKYYRNYVDCIKCNNRSLIESALIKILEREGFYFIHKLPENISVDQLAKNSVKLNLELDGGKLLYFQPPEYYQQLKGSSKILSEIAAKY